MKRWYVLFTGYENSLVTMKRLVKSCLPKGCGAYIPVVLKENKDRPKRVYNHALYPFYLFICCTEERQLGILKQKMRKLMIDGYFLTTPSGTPATLTSDDIRNLENTQTDINAYLGVNTKGISAGDRIKVVSGPMNGFSGSVAFTTPDYVYVSMVTKKGKLPIEVPMFYSDVEKI